MWRGGIRLLDDAFDFFQLFHQVELCWQPASSIYQHYVFAAGLAGRDCVKTHSGWIASRLRDDIDRVARGPNTQLLFGCCTKRIGCSQ